MADYRAVDDHPYRIAYGHLLFRPFQGPDPKMSRRRRRRLRGKRNAGLLPPWGFAPLGDIDEFCLTVRERPIPRTRLPHHDLRRN